MKLKYINQIKVNINNFSNKKTSNLLDGTYRSVYKGKSLNFDGLRTYEIYDDVKDIDWKASSRSGQVLVKQYVSDKKHNVLFVLDSGLKMEANANIDEIKKEIALYTAGTLGYLAVKNGDFIGFLFNSDRNIEFFPFKTDFNKLEEYLTFYDSKMSTKSKRTLNDDIDYILKNLRKRMIIFIITDIGGLNNLDVKSLKKLSLYNDIMLVNIGDINMEGEELFDLDSKSFIPKIFLNDKHLNEIESNLKEKMFSDNKNKLNKNSIDMASINRKNEINIRIIELLERHRYGNNR